MTTDTKTSRKARGHSAHKRTTNAPKRPIFELQALEQRMLLSQSVALAAVADAYVQNDATSTNYGGSSELIVKNAGSPARHAYLRFDIDDLTTAVEGATLRLYGKQSPGTTSAQQMALYPVADTTWSELSVTWGLPNPKPAMTTTTSLDTETVSGTTAVWYEWNVASYVEAARAANQQYVSFGLQSTNSTSSYATFSSRDHGTSTLRPQLVVTSADAAPTLAEYILDNDSSSGVTKVGGWTNSTTDAGYYGANYAHDANGSKGSKSVTYAPTIANAGAYDVYARWTANSLRATNVPIDVVHDGVTTTVVVNQQTNNNAWVKLGNWSFAAGTGGSVTIRTTGTDGFVIADAVRFTQVTPPASPAAPTAVRARAGSTVGQVGVDLTWSDESGNEGGFLVERSTNGGTTWQPLATTVAEAESYFDYGLSTSTSYLYRVTAVNAGGASDAIESESVTTLSAAGVRSAYGGTAWPIAAGSGGSYVEAEDYDAGGEGVAYHDSTDGNAGNRYRKGDVDVQQVNPDGIGSPHSIAWWGVGEWQYYRINVLEAGTYRLEATVASDGGGGKFHVEFSGGPYTTGTVHTPQLTMPDTGSGDQTQVIGVDGIDLQAGEQTLRVYCDALSGGGFGEIDRLRLVRTAAPIPGALILDNNSTGVTTVGSWTVGTASPGYYGSNYLHDNNGGKGSKSVTYAPTLTQQGRYAVAARWAGGGNRATNVPYDVTHKDGLDTFSRNQQGGSATWSTFGTFRFDAGTSGSVTIRTTGTSGYVEADAVRFVLQVPDTPTGLTAAPSSAAQVDVGWTAAFGAGGYTLQRRAYDAGTSAWGGWSVVTDAIAGSATTYADVGVAAGTQYEYRLFATNTAGDSIASNADDATTPPSVSLPAAPTGLGALKAVSNSVNLHWTDNAGNEDGYEVQMRIPDGSYVTVTPNQVSASTARLDLSAGTTAYFRVRAYNAAGNSAWSNETLASTLSDNGSPSNLVGMLVGDGDYGVHLSWARGAERYTNIERSQDGVTFAQVGVFDSQGSANTYVDSTILPEKKYYYRVADFVSSGSTLGPYSNVFHIVSPSRELNAPAPISATLTADAVKIQWTDRSFGESRHEVERSTDGVNFTKIFDRPNYTGGPAIETQYDHNVVIGSTYYYRARSYYTADSTASPYSAVVSVTVSTVYVPATPSNLYAVTSSTSPTSITLHWRDNSSTETYFNVQQMINAQWVTIATPGANSTTYVVTNLANGASYNFRVQAGNEGGTSDHSNAASGVAGQDVGSGEPGEGEPGGGDGGSSEGPGFTGAGLYMISLGEMEMDPNNGIKNFTDNIQVKSTEYVTANSLQEALLDGIEGHIVVQPSSGQLYHGGNSVTFDWGETAFKIPTLTYDSEAEVFTGMISLEDLYGWYLDPNNKSDEDYNDVWWDVTVQRLALDSLDITVKDPVHPTNTVFNEGTIYIEQTTAESPVTIDLSGVLSESTDEHKKHTLWEIDVNGNGADPLKGDFTAANRTVTLAPDSNRTFYIKAGFDSDGDGELDDSEGEYEVTRTITVGLVYINSITVADNLYQNDVKVTATLPQTPPLPDLYIGEQTDGTATLKITGDILTDDALGRSHVIYRLDMGGGNVSFGYFDGNGIQGIEVPTNGNRDFTLTVGFDDDNSGTLDDGIYAPNEVTSRFTIHLVDLVKLAVFEPLPITTSKIEVTEPPPGGIKTLKIASTQNVVDIELEATLIGTGGPPDQLRRSLWQITDSAQQFTTTGTFENRVVEELPFKVNLLYRIDAGYDDNNDGVLQQSEVSRSAHVQLASPVFIQHVYDAIEGGIVEFILKRSGSLSEDLTVELEMRGTAREGFDYLPGTTLTTTIPVGIDAIVLSIPTLQNGNVEISRTIEMTLIERDEYVHILPVNDDRRQRHKLGIARAYIDDDDTGPMRPVANYPAPGPMNTVAQDTATGESSAFNCEEWAFNTPGEVKFDAAISYAVTAGLLWDDSSHNVELDDGVISPAMMKRILESMLYNDGSPLQGYRTFFNSPVPQGWHRIIGYHRNYGPINDFHFATEDYDPVTGLWSWSDKEGEFWDAGDTDPYDEPGIFLSHYMINTPPRQAAATD